MVSAVLAANQLDPTRLLVVLQQVQHELGFVPNDAVGQIAVGLGLSRAEVHGVISFYHDIRTEPAGRHVLKVCQAESCQATGGRALTQHIQDVVGCELGDTSADGAITLEAVYCLGLCAASPAVMIDERPIARVTVARIDRVVESARSAS
ncbi:MAG: formate dehydrogenase subunit gamma [Actinobacteria bacterium]|nr:formate dehydrogenase subunit gamma [Actinomycetota bacterium]